MANVLFVTQSLSFGGAAKMLSYVAESLDARQHKVCIANLKGTKNVTNYERSISNTIQVHDFSEMSRKAQILGIRKLAKSFQADVIVGFTTFPNLYAVIVGKLLGIPSIMSERGDPSFTKGTTLKAKIVGFLINRSRGGVFQTEGAMKFYGKKLQKRGVIIPNPIYVKGDVPQVDYSQREKTVVSVGRLDNTQKRYDVMLDAFKLFSDKHSEYILKLYGDGNDKDLIKDWVKQRGLTDKVRFMGLTTQPMQDIAYDGMFLITSDYEGISNSLLEAMAVGLPCVSTDHSPGGARLLIQSGTNGLLAPVGDAKALSEAMCCFAEDAELACKCGENAKDVVNRFEPTKIIDMWEGYINNICKFDD